MSEWPPKRPHPDATLQQTLADAAEFVSYPGILREKKGSTWDLGGKPVWRFTYTPQRLHHRDTYRVVPSPHASHADPHQHSLTKKVKP